MNVSIDNVAAETNMSLGAYDIAGVYKIDSKYEDRNEISQSGT